MTSLMKWNKSASGTFLSRGIDMNWLANEVVEALTEHNPNHGC